MKHRIFAKTGPTNLRERLFEMTQTGAAEIGNQLSNRVRLREAIFDMDPDAQLAIDASGSLAMANDLARKMLGLGIRDIGRPFSELEASIRPVDLRSMVDRVRIEKKTADIKDVEWEKTSGEKVFLEILAIPLFEKDHHLAGTSITFIDVTSHKLLERQLENTNQEPGHLFPIDQSGKNISRRDPPDGGDIGQDRFNLHRLPDPGQREQAYPHLDLR